MKKAFKYLLINPLAVLLLLALLVLGVSAFLTLSQTGSRILLQNAQQLVPALQLEGINGALARDLQLEKIRWQDAGVDVNVSQAQLQTRVDFALPATVQVDSLSAQRVEVHLPVSSDEDTESQAIEIPAIALPVQLDIQQLHIAELLLVKGEQRWQARDIELQADARDGRLYIENLVAQAYDDQGQADVSLQGTLGLGEEHPLDAQLQLVSDGYQAWGKGQARLQLGGLLQQYTLALQGDWQYADYPVYQAKLEGEGSFQDLQIEQLQLQGEAGQLNTTGHLAWQDGIQWQADIEAEQVNPAPFVTEWPADLDVKLSSTGQWSTEQRDIALDITQLKGSLQEYPVDVTGKGQWNGQTLLLQALDAHVGDNRLQATGDATEDTVSMQWALDAKNLAQLYPDVQGRAQGEGTLQGQLDGSQLQLVIDELQGRITKIKDHAGDYELGAKGQLTWGNNLLSAQDLVVESGGNRVEVSGQAMEPFDLQWQVDAKNLAKAWQGLGGTLQGEGSLRGTIAKPEIQADLQGSKLRYQDYRLQALNLQIAQHGERYELQGKLDGIEASGQQIKTVQLDGGGTLTDHRMQAKLDHADGKLGFVAQGGWEQERWQGTVSQLSLRDTPAGNWQADEAVRLKASAQAVQSSNVCLRNANGASVCVEPTWQQPNVVQASGKVRQLPLVMLRSFLPENIQVAGVADADFQVAQQNGKPRGNLELRLADSRIKIKPPKGRTEVLRYQDTSLKLQLVGQRIDTQGYIKLSDYGDIAINGGVTLAPDPKRLGLDLSVDVAMPSITWLERFSPQIDRLQGAVNGKINIKGSVQRPDVRGRLDLAGGEVFLPEAGVTLRNIGLRMQARGSERADISGSLQAGNGQLQLKGLLSFANLPDLQAEVSLDGDNLLLMNTHEIQALVSPRLKVKLAKKRVDIRGTVEVPEATVSLSELPQGAKKLSDDVVITRFNQPVTGTGISPQTEANMHHSPLDIYPDVTLKLGKKIKLSGFGFDANLRGSLHVVRTQQDIVGQGVLRILNGVYKAYGQNLQIERGRLLFNGPLANPGLDVQAVREVDGGDIEVGITLTGTANQPESTLFSSPQQTQSDTLSYLLTGQSASRLTGDQASVLNSAITGLGIAGGESLAQKVGGSIGLDEVGLNTRGGNLQQSELALGKRLGPRLYLRYIVGLFDSLKKVAITYEINKRLQLQAETGLHQSLDLLYKLNTNSGPLGPPADRK